MNQNRGEPQCPRCGSSNLTYKNVFDYYKCNDCRITFITPVYSYGQEANQGLDSAKDIAGRIFGGTRNEMPETGDGIPEVPGIPVTPAAEVQAPAPKAEKSPARPRPVRREKAAGANNRGNLVAFLLIIIIILVLVIIWLLFGDQLIELFSGLA